MTESEAYDLALDYMRQLDITHYGCLYKSSWSAREVFHLLVGPPNFPRGVRQKLWFFTFAGTEPSAECVVSGGDHTIFVDEDTGICGQMYSL
jgi:hypothetical protein